MNYYHLSTGSSEFGKKMYVDCFALANFITNIIVYCYDDDMAFVIFGTCIQMSCHLSLERQNIVV